MSRLTSELLVKLNDQVSGPAGKMSGALKKATSDLGKIDVYKGQAKRLDELAQAHQRAREKVRELAQQLMSASSPSKSLQASYARATAAVETLGNKLDWQKARVRGAASELERMGVSAHNLANAEKVLQASIDRTSAAMKRQEAAAARSQRRREALGNAAALAGGIAAYRGKEMGKKAIVSAAEFDIGTRKQREVTDLTKEDQAGLLKQATKIGQDTQFSNLDVVKAQTKAMQGLPTNITGRLKAEVAEGILENVKNYALVMEADLETSAEAIRSYLQATGKDISTKEKALAEANKATNQLVKMAKLGGMSDEDVQQYIKYAVPTGSAAGLTPESMMAIAALARRGGLRGDEAGVFMRSTASKIAAPTKDGLAALNAAGIRYSDYVRMPSRLSMDGLQGQFRNDMGLNFNDATRKRLDGVLGNQELLGDRGKFIAAVTEAVSGQMEKTKKGTMKPADRVKVSKSAGKFHQMSAESVDAEALLDAVMSSSMTLAQLNAFLTNKHGGKGAITQRQRDEYVAGRNELKKTGDDPDFAKRKADEIMAGLGGSLERLKGSVENLYLSFGQANEKLLTFSFDKIGNTIDSISNMSDTARQAATALGVLAGVGAGGYAFLRFSQALLGMGGPGAALTGSAVALDASAAALTAAAGRLGVAGVAGSAGGAAGTAAGAAGAAAGGGWLARLGAAGRAGIYGLIGLGLWEGGKAIRQGNEKRFEGVAPGEAHNDGRKRQKSVTELWRQRREEFKRLQGSPGAPDAAGGGSAAVDTSALKEAEDKAKATGEAMQSSLDVTATPKVDTSQLDAALAKTRALKTELEGLGASAAAAASRSTGVVGRAMRGIHADGD